VLFALVLLLAATDPSRPPVALMPLQSLGLDADTIRALELTLRNELSQLPEARLLPEKDAATAARAGARQLIVATASQLGDSFLIDLKLVDAKTGQLIRRATHPVSGSRDALIETLREGTVELLAPSRFVGGLQVEVPDAPGAAVFVDGRRVGTVPLASSIDGLLPGQHTLRVVDKGRERSTFVEIHYGRVGKARVELGRK
jgi:hypothetical protein